jgi:hypothetical protein
MKNLTKNQLNYVNGGAASATTTSCEALKQELRNSLVAANDVANTANATSKTANTFADNVNALLDKYK